MENGMKQLFIKRLEKDLRLKIIALKKEQKLFDTIGGIKTLMKDTKKDEVDVILEKLQMFSEKQIAEEIEVYEEALSELQKIKPDEKDIETNGMVA